MTTDLHTLAAAVVQSPHWRWMPWMLADYAAGMVTRPVRLTDDRHPSYPDEYDWPHDLGLRVPNLRDPATLGCLLALVREAWGDPKARTTALMIPGRWRVVVHDLAGYPKHQWFDAGSEPAALVAALLAAPHPAR